MTHHIGIIGLGIVGGRFVEQFARHDAFDVVAAWDLDPVARARFGDRVAIVDSPDAVIAAADAVYIAVPPQHHRQYVEACLAAGTAVFCEKPLGIDVAESERLVAAVEASGLPAGINFVYSSAPAAVTLDTTIAGGQLGDLVSAELRLHFAEWPRAWQADATWLAERAQGGWVREVASHHLFLLSRVLGEVAVRQSNVAYPDGPAGSACEGDLIAELTAGATSVTLVGTVGGASPDVVELTIRGAIGSIRLADWYRVATSSGPAWEPVGDEDKPALADAAYRAQLGELDEMLSGRPHRIATFADALAVQRVVEQLLT